MNDRAPPRRAPDLARQALKARRWRDSAVLLPLLGVFLLLSPVVSIYGSESRIFGLPAVVVFIFGAWALLILLTRIIARNVSSDDAQDR